jgi:hypothetical protein
MDEVYHIGDRTNLYTLDFPDDISTRGSRHVKDSKMYAGFILILTVILLWYPVAAGSIQVPDQISTVQEAIRLARPGDTIYIHGGVYSENLIINKKVNLVGVTNTTSGTPPGPPAVQIEPGYPLLTSPPAPLLSYAVIAPDDGNAVEIRADGVRITDLVLISREDCIKIGNYGDVDIEGCLLGQCKTGISGNGGDNLAIIGNRFQAPERTGLDLTYIADTRIESNLFFGGVTGIRAENIQRWSVRDNTFQDLKVAFSGNGVSDSVLQENALENCSIGYTLLSSRNNIVQADRFHNLTQYLLLLNSLAHQVNIGNGNNATTISRDLSSATIYRTPWLTIAGQNFAFALAPSGTYSGFRTFGDRVQIESEINRTQDSDAVKIDAEADVRMWEDIDPFTFGVYRVDRGAPLFTGITYVSGQSIRTTTILNASADGTYALLAKKKIPFGLTIEGITSVFLLIAALVALFLYQRRRAARKGPSRSRAQEFRKM